METISRLNARKGIFKHRVLTVKKLEKFKRQGQKELNDWMHDKRH